jgi:hypothetical protein
MDLKDWLKEPETNYKSIKSLMSVELFYPFLGKLKPNKLLRIVVYNSMYTIAKVFLIKINDIT